MLRRGVPLIASLLLGCGGDSFTIVMNAQNNSGEDGFATLTSKGGDTTQIYLQIRRPLTQEAQQQVHIHPQTCGEIGTIWRVLNTLQPPSVPANQVDAVPEALRQGDDGGFLVSVTNVDAGMTLLTTNTLAINAHDAQDFALYVSCGQIQK